MLLSSKRGNSTATAGSRRSVASLPVRAYVHVPTWVWLRRRKGYRGLSAMNDCGARNLAWLPSSRSRYAWKIPATSTLAGAFRGFTQELDLLCPSRLPHSDDRAIRKPVSSNPHLTNLERLLSIFLSLGSFLVSEQASFRYDVASNACDRPSTAAARGSDPKFRLAQILAVSTVNTWAVMQSHSVDHAMLQVQFRRTTRSG